MRLIKPSFVIETGDTGEFALNKIEQFGRVCHKSEDKITEDSSRAFVTRLLAMTPPHESVLEHCTLSIRFIVDRGVTHELVRHRMASYSQESTRYCNYKGGVTFVIPRG